jgi:isovaleryl-CoA dehydrogenase
MPAENVLGIEGGGVKVLMSGLDSEDAAGAILYAAEKATWMAGEAIQVLGGNGYINQYPTPRLWRDAKLYEIGAGTIEIRRMLIGRELFSETM